MRVTDQAVWMHSAASGPLPEQRFFAYSTRNTTQVISVSLRLVPGEVLHCADQAVDQCFDVRGPQCCDLGVEGKGGEGVRPGRFV